VSSGCVRMLVQLCARCWLQSIRLCRTVPPALCQRNTCSTLQQAFATRRASMRRWRDWHRQRKIIQHCVRTVGTKRTSYKHSRGATASRAMARLRGACLRMHQPQGGRSRIGSTAGGWWRACGFFFIDQARGGNEPQISSRTRSERACWLAALGQQREARRASSVARTGEPSRDLQVAFTTAAACVPAAAMLTPVPPMQRTDGAGRHGAGACVRRQQRGQRERALLSYKAHRLCTEL
jgi:hypothetical protein